MKKEKRPSALSEGEESSLERFVRGEMECDPDVVPVPDAAPRQAKNAPDAQQMQDFLVLFKEAGYTKIKIGG